MDSKEKVLNELKEKGIPMKAGEIVSSTGLEEKDVKKAIKILKTEGLIDSPKFCYYAVVS